ncbi:hypothetical protein B0H66DRAFT_71373 [Apodospora peruviana]|uniref:Secreted protein n=1 Tax=Apodospora peruviana TaxID=516989 RepID=A0AAE0MFK4_9PEZI|nr:hypothetical protein B0H66DRAFT_71373 [Apodospora peruviana]
MTRLRWICLSAGLIIDMISVIHTKRTRLPPPFVLRWGCCETTRATGWTVELLGGMGGYSVPQPGAESIHTGHLFETEAIPRSWFLGHLFGDGSP